MTALLAGHEGTTSANESVYKSPDNVDTEADTNNSKVLVLLAGYLFYALYETVWCVRGFLNADGPTMLRHSSRLFAVHFHVLRLIVSTIRVLIAFIYFSLVGSHRFLCLALFSEIPKTLFPQRITKGQYYISVSYIMAYKVIGYMLYGLGLCERRLKETIHRLRQSWTDIT